MLEYTASWKPAGIEKGQLAILREVSEELAALRFGELPEELARWIQSEASITDLRALVLRTMIAPSLADLRN